jgi:CIC family chloride channel protein
VGRDLTARMSADAASRAASVPRFRRAFTEDHLFLLLAIIIGIVGGAAVVCFRFAIDGLHAYLLGPAPSHARLIVVPTAIGLVVAALVMRFFPRTRGSGVNQTKAALYIYDGYIPFRTAIGKFICSALAIGSGQSLGPEDPSLQIGASIASLFGRKLKLSREKLRLIAPIGATAGLAAAFNAPISAVLFVIEEVVGRWSAGIFGATVLAAVSAVVVERGLLGSEPIFHIPDVAPARPAELLAYAALGVVGAFASVAFSRGISWLRPALKRMPRWTQYLQPAIAGLTLGVIGAVGVPQVMGAGYDAIDQAMHGNFTWQFLALLAVVKILATTISFSSGTPGGMFAPTLFIGAMLGGAVRGVERAWIPHLAGSVGTYALVGMGVLFAGFLRAPMTSVFMVLEVSGDYSIVTPVLVANTIAYLIARNLDPIPIFDRLSRQDGLELPSMEEEREAVIWRVEDAMRPLDVPVLHCAQSVAEALRTLEHSQSGFALVEDEHEEWTTVSVAALEHAMQAGKADSSLSEVLAPERVAALFPDHPVGTALSALATAAQVPVVHRADQHKVVGLIALQDVLALFRRLEEKAAADGTKPQA